MATLIFDTETTGLVDNHSLPLDKQPEVIEFYGAFLDLDTGEIADEIELLIKPKRGVPDESKKITGIGEETLAEAEAEDFSAAADRIAGAIESADAVVAHNLSFDQEIVNIEFERLGRKLKWPDKMLCTVEQTVFMKGHRLSLMALHEELFGEKFDEAHRAKSDTQALIRCVVELHKRGEL